VLGWGLADGGAVLAGAEVGADVLGAVEDDVGGATGVTDVRDGAGGDLPAPGLDAVPQAARTRNSRPIKAGHAASRIPRML